MSDQRSDSTAGWLEEFQPFPEEHSLYGSAARRSGLETAHWARQVLNRAARSILELEPSEPVDEVGFAAVFSAAPSPMLLLAPDEPSFTILAANDAYLRATMTRREEIVGRSLFEAFPDNPDDHAATRSQRLRASLARVVRHQRSDTMTLQKYDIPRPRGAGGGFEERHWSTINTPVLDRNGQLTCMIHRVEDVTELVMLERMDKTREAVADSFRALAAERQMEIVRRSREISEARDILQKEFASQTGDLQELSREVARRGHELNEALAQVRAKEELQRFLADATALLAESLDLNETLGRVARLSIPIFADWCLLDVFTGNQRLERMAVAHADPADRAIAERVRAYRPDLHANPQYPATRVMLGRGPVLIERFDPGAARTAAHDDGHLALIESLGVRSAICVGLSARGKDLGFLTFMTTRSGRQYGPSDVVVAQDIARRCALAIENARLFEEARSALRMRDEFLSVASHELRTPLTPLQLQVDAMERKFADFVKSGKETWLEERLTSIRRQTDRLELLVEELLEMSHVVAGSISLHPEPMDLTGLVEDAVARFREHHPEQEIALQLAPALAGGWDRERLGQVLVGLLSNAFRHGAGHPIVVTASRQGEWALVSVTDGRDGVAPRDHRRVSTAAPGPASQNYGGLGVGLFVTRQILDAMGGTIEASSGAGGGATFTVRLPLARAALDGLSSESTMH